MVRRARGYVGLVATSTKYMYVLNQVASSYITIVLTILVGSTERHVFHLNAAMRSVWQAAFSYNPQFHVS